MVPLHARLLIVRSEADLVAGWKFSNREQGFNRSSQSAEAAEIVTNRDEDEIRVLPFQRRNQLNRQ